MLRKLVVRVFRSSTPLGRIFSHELLKIFEPTSRKSTKFVFEFCGLDPSGKLAPVDIATFSCFNQDFSTIFRTSPLPLQRYHEKLFRRFLSRNQPADIFLFGGNPFVGGTFWATARCCSGPLWMGIPQWMRFSRPQLVVVSGLFGWESLSGWDFLGHNLLLSQASFFSMEFWLSRSLSHELFLFSQWNSGYHKAFLTNFFLFSRWNCGYHKAFFTNFFFFHDGIVAITKPFSRTFSFFMMEFWLSQSLFHELFLFSRLNSGYHKAFFTNFFFFHDGILAITKPFS
jgi:hypothetical protein